MPCRGYRFVDNKQTRLIAPPTGGLPLAMGNPPVGGAITFYRYKFYKAVTPTGQRLFYSPVQANYSFIYLPVNCILVKHEETIIQPKFPGNYWHFARCSCRLFV